MRGDGRIDLIWQQLPKATRDTIVFALREAGRTGHREARVEHLLLGVLREFAAPGGFRLADFGIDVDAVRRELAVALAPGPGPATDVADGFSGGALHVLRRAADDAKAIGHEYVGDDHLLLAILATKDGRTDAGAALARAGVTYDGLVEAWRTWSRARKQRRSKRHLRALDAIVATARTLANRPRQAYGVFVGRSVGHPRFVTDPYPLYRWLRDHAPVRRDPVAPVWVVTRYADVDVVLRDPRFKKDPWGSGRLPEKALEQLEASDDAHARSAAGATSMLFLDPPRHTRVRNAFARAFTPRTIDALRPRIRQIAHERIDRVAKDGRTDLIPTLAYPLPVMVIAELLGLPAADYERLKSWSDDLAASLSLHATAEDRSRAGAARKALRAYFDENIERIRREPTPQPNLLSTLLPIADDANDPALHHAELFSNCVLLLAAGHETTTNLIGNGVLALLRHPDQLTLLRDDPSMIPAALEELLRYDCPVQWATRMAGEDIALGGATIPRDAVVLASLGSANRDPAQFPDPDQLDVRRPDIKHLAFGHGPHYCLGAALARMEAEIAIGALVERLPNLALATKKLTWQKGMTFRGVKALPVTW